MKRRISALITAVLVLAFALCACSTAQENGGEKYDIRTLTADENSMIRIDAKSISTSACYYDYTVDSTTVQLVALRDNSGGVHIAFNTCQSCSPSPKAFFLPKGELLECQSCKNLFSAYQVGIESGGCNPMPIEGAVITGDEISFSAEALRANAPAFKNWAGPKN